MEPKRSFPHSQKPNTDLGPEQSTLLPYMPRSSYQILYVFLLWALPISPTLKSSLYLFLATVKKDLPLEFFVSNMVYENF
jgi:hypothetical protein